MAYAPNNAQIFVAAFSGCLAGMGTSNRNVTDSNSASYNPLSSVAGAFAKACDTAWGNVRTATLLDTESMQSLCQSYWESRSPLASSDNVIPATHSAAALAIIAMITSGEAYFASEGITPPSPGGVTPAYLNVSSSIDRLAINQFDAIIFENEDVNEGFTYNPVTGIFTPIADGWYEMTWTVQAQDMGETNGTFSLIDSGGAGPARTSLGLTNNTAPGPFDGDIFGIGRTSIVHLLNDTEYSIGNVTAVACNIRASNGPSATLAITRIA